MIDIQADSLGAGSPRDSGPIISKWEQLSLAPDLLRSLNKFGCVDALVFVFLSNAECSYQCWAT